MPRAHRPGLRLQLAEHVLKNTYIVFVEAVDRELEKLDSRHSALVNRYRPESNDETDQIVVGKLGVTAPDRLRDRTYRRHCHAVVLQPRSQICLLVLCTLRATSRPELGLCFVRKQPDVHGTAIVGSDVLTERRHVPLQDRHGGPDGPYSWLSASADIDDRAFATLPDDRFVAGRCRLSALRANRRG